MKKIIGAAMPALVAGVAIGYFAAGLVDGGETEVAAPQKKETKVVKVGLEDKSDVAALRARIRELERANRDEKTEVAVNEAGGERPRREGPRNPGEWIENFRKSNPERYTQITNRMASWSAERKQRANSRLEFLASVDTSTMSAAERKNHNRLQDLLMEREDVQAKLEAAFASGDFMNENNRELMTSMRELSQEIDELNTSERDLLIKKTAEALGFQGEDVGEISSTMKQIIDSTESDAAQMMRGFGRAFGRGGRGGGRGQGGQR